VNRLIGCSRFLGTAFPKFPKEDAAKDTHAPSNRPEEFLEWTVPEETVLKILEENCTYVWRDPKPPQGRPGVPPPIDNFRLSWWSLDAGLPVLCNNKSADELAVLRAKQPPSALPVCWGGASGLPNQRVEYVLCAQLRDPLVR
jgi:hypothetical protein